MSPHAGFVLLNEVQPRLRSIIPNIKGVGCDDVDELLADATAIAAKMLHDLEARQKHVTAGNVVFYTILHIKSGRRSGGCGRTDALAASTQLDGKSMCLSMEEVAGVDPDSGDEIPLGEMLADSHLDDPSSTATRLLDWDGFLEHHNPSYRSMVEDIATGKTSVESAREIGSSYFAVRQLRQKLAEDLREWFGDDVIADALHAPAWRGGIHAEKERFCCRADRRRW